jgi:hypothetical protein
MAVPKAFPKYTHSEEGMLHEPTISPFEPKVVNPLENSGYYKYHEF